MNKIKYFIVFGVIVVSFGVFKINPTYVYADAANPSLMELIGKNPDMECVAADESVYPYGGGGYVECDLSNTKDTCPQAQSKYYKFLGDKVYDYDIKLHAYFYCPTVQYEVAQCDQGEELVKCGVYYPPGSGGGFDSAPAGISCGSYGRFPYVLSGGQHSESAEFQKFKKDLRFLITSYSKFDQTDKYCRKITLSTASTTQQNQTPEKETKAPIDNRIIILIGAIVLSVAIIATGIIFKVRHDA